MNLLKSIKNILTIDVEDYFQVHAFSTIVKPDDWEMYECRVEKNTTKILDILDKEKIKATFFILGWIAERYPNLIKKIYQESHEIASHGYEHQVIYNQTPAEFRKDIKKSKQLLEDLIGEEVIGYRAPTYSVTEKTLWALTILFEEGYRYDSSVFPIHHDYYGIPWAPRFPFIWDLTSSKPKIKQIISINNQYNKLKKLSKPNNSMEIIEFPISTINLVGYKFPIAGGGYFRLLPYWITKWGLKKINKKDKQPFIFYFHPWELDPGQPKIQNASKFSRFRHYNNIEKGEKRFKQLLADFELNPLKEILKTFGIISQKK